MDGNNVTAEKILAVKFVETICCADPQLRLQHAEEFKILVHAYQTEINRDLLYDIGCQLGEYGGDDLVRFVDLVLLNQTLPV